MKETELAKYFIEYLSDYDLYFEIPGLDVDIVAKHGNILMAFEVKTSLNFKVIEQAARNCHWFHYSYVCVPYNKRFGFARHICRDYGIGILGIRTGGGIGWGSIFEIEKAVLHRSAHKTIDYVLSKLTAYSKRSIPGASGSDGTRITTFKLTIEAVINYVKRHPDPTIKEVLENINHHYSSLSSAKSSLYQWVRQGVIKEFYFDKGIVKLKELTKDI